MVPDIVFIICELDEISSFNIRDRNSVNSIVGSFKNITLLELSVNGLIFILVDHLTVLLSLVVPSNTTFPKPAGVDSYTWTDNTKSVVSRYEAYPDFPIS